MFNVEITSLTVGYINSIFSAVLSEVRVHKCPNHASGTFVLAYTSSKHHAYVLSDTGGGRCSKKSELKSLLLVLDTTLATPKSQTHDLYEYTETNPRPARPTHTPGHDHTYARAHTQTHVERNTHAHAHAHVLTRTHTHSRRRTHAQAHAYAHPDNRETRARAPTHIRTHKSRIAPPIAQTSNPQHYHPHIHPVRVVTACAGGVWLTQQL